MSLLTGLLLWWLLLGDYPRFEALTHILDRRSRLETAVHHGLESFMPHYGPVIGQAGEFGQYFGVKVV